MTRGLMALVGLREVAVLRAGARLAGLQRELVVCQQARQSTESSLFEQAREQLRLAAGLLGDGDALAMQCAIGCLDRIQARRGMLQAEVADARARERAADRSVSEQRQRFVLGHARLRAVRQWLVGQHSVLRAERQALEEERELQDWSGRRCPGSGQSA